ncbi:outer membrane protein assembly factor BamD [Oceanicoccus sp. KOV_DT_Chl]|uniref:outer membrane protein assembly factor BamD n=1 Tax=Oceanicoccus sp. KOV_DT_Chl TaxID=1904639 RepID=UPI000C79FB40|nr:outer membrane protein assembly factor BamD [Oceanicoccus sp. KOV_DT_Chl]
MNITARALFITLLFTIGLMGCSSDDDRPQDMTEKELYQQAQENLKDESFQSAVRNLQLLEARYPFGPYAEQAQLEIIFAYYRSFEPEAAIAAADRFVRLHPQHPNVDYAFYMKGLSNYIDGEGFLDRFLPTDMTQRDPGAALQSFEDFRQLLYRFPDSPYAADAKARMTYLRARLARYEINVANYYFKRGAYLAAANRGRYVVENFPQTPAIPDALAVMVQAYKLLGLDELAEKSLTVLHSNYPKHPSLDKNGQFIDKFTLAESKRSWVNVATLGIFDHSAPPKFDNRAEYLIR